MFKWIGQVIRKGFSPSAEIGSKACCGGSGAHSAGHPSASGGAFASGEGTVPHAPQAVADSQHGSNGTHEHAQGAQGDGSGPFGRALRVIRRGMAMRVIFFYPGEEGTYVDHAEVILYENGMVHIFSNQEETTTHLQNCEILWRFETDAEDRANKVRLLKPEKKAEKKSDKKGHSPSAGEPSNLKGVEASPLRDVRDGRAGEASGQAFFESEEGESEGEAEECFEKGPAPTVPTV
jgi:hypothetical protein